MKKVTSTFVSRKEFGIAFLSEMFVEGNGLEFNSCKETVLHHHGARTFRLKSLCLSETFSLGHKISYILLLE